jgi:hypothetical protein
MKKLSLTSAFAGALFLVGVAQAGVVEQTVTTESTTYQGTVTELIPSSSTLVVKSATAPATRYVYTDKTTFVDAAGNVVTRESITDQPVTVYYTADGGVSEVTKVVVQKPAAVIPGTVVEETTRTVRELP